MQSASPGATTSAAAASEAEPALTLVIPAHNETARLPATLDALGRFLDDWGIDYRVLVVDDGSRDGTATLTHGRGPRFSTHSLARNRGKGAAVRCGMLQARGQIVGFLDADLSCGLACLRRGYEALQGGAAEAVLGTRTVNGAGTAVRRHWLRKVASAVFRALARRLIAGEASDPQAGFKMFRRNASQQIFSRTTVDGFAFDVEVILLLRRLRLPFVEVPIDHLDDRASSLVVPRHALPMLLEVVRIYLRSRRGWYDRQAPAATTCGGE
jgi:dolichyl-phosphate beta-glucosyltransferase